MFLNYNTKLKRIWKEAVSTYFEVLSKTIPKGIKDNHSCTIDLGKVAVQGPIKAYPLFIQGQPLKTSVRTVGVPVEIRTCHITNVRSSIAWANLFGAPGFDSWQGQQIFCRHSVDIGSQAHRASYSVFIGDKAAAAWSSPLRPVKTAWSLPSTSVKFPWHST
jgi:hypothetical protein